MTSMRPLAALLLLSATAVAADDPPAASPDAKAALDAAVLRSVDLTAKSDWSGALDALRAVETKFGATSRAEENAARVHLAHAAAEAESGEDPNLVRALYADATTCAKKAVELDRDSASAVVVFSQGARGYGDLAAARAALTEFLDAHPQDVVARWEWAKWNFESRQWPDAEREFAKIVALSPKDGRATLCLAIAREALHAPIETLERGYLDAARLLPDDDAPLQRLANLHAKDREKKLALFDKVIAENPKAVWARVWIAYVLRSEAPIDAKKALATLREAAAVAPDNAAVRWQVGQALEEARDVAGAVAEYTLCVEKRAVGDARDASDALDRILFAGEGSGAVTPAARERAYDAVVAKNPDVGRYGNNAGLWYRDAKNYEKSLKFYLASVKAEPDSQDYLNDTGLIYLFHLTDRRDKCLPLLERAVALVEKDGAPPKRGYWDALENLCKYWFENRQWKKVVEYADRRASPKANLDGRPYPSRVAAGYREQALKELETK